VGKQQDFLISLPLAASIAADASLPLLLKYVTCSMHQVKLRKGFGGGGG
jgi:hypothetical protein